MRGDRWWSKHSRTAFRSLCGKMSLADLVESSAAIGSAVQKFGAADDYEKLIEVEREIKYRKALAPPEPMPPLRKHAIRNGPKRRWSW